MKKILLTALVLAGISATAQVKVGSNPTTLATDAKFQVEGSTGAQTVILNNGNVGIGTTTPQSILHVVTNPQAQNTEGSVLFGPNQSYGISFKNVIDGSGQPSSYIYAPTAGNGNLNYVSKSSGGFHAFFTQDIERMRINYIGNVGIGTTTPTAKLEVVGNIKEDGANVVSSPGNFIHGGSPYVLQNIKIYSGNSTTDATGNILVEVPGANFTFSSNVMAMPYNATPISSGQYFTGIAVDATHIKLYSWSADGTPNPNQYIAFVVIQGF